MSRKNAARSILTAKIKAFYGETHMRVWDKGEGRDYLRVVEEKNTDKELVLEWGWGDTQNPHAGKSSFPGGVRFKFVTD